MTRPLPPDTPASVDDVTEPARIVDLQLTDYAATYRLQQELAEQRYSGSLDHDLFLVTEHPATFTLGRRGGRENLMVSEEFLQQKKIPLVHIERGGDITYHGPGQLVIYPIVHMRRSGLSVAGYVQLLEETMIRLAEKAGVTAVRDPRNHGVWVNSKKLGSVGIAIRHGVSFHGLAINVNNSLEPFSWVNPCGLAGVLMTTISSECGRKVSTDEMKMVLVSILEDVFKRKFSTAPREQYHDRGNGQG